MFVCFRSCRGGGGHGCSIGRREGILLGVGGGGWLWWLLHVGLRTGGGLWGCHETFEIRTVQTLGREGEGKVGEKWG